MSGLLRDLQYSLRALRRSPGFTAAAVACLALGIGANTTVFTFANEFLLRSPQVERPERLVRIFTAFSGGIDWGSLAYPEWHDLSRDVDVFSGVVLERPLPLNASAGEHPERIWGTMATRNYFEVLGVEPILGRGFLDDPALPRGADDGVILAWDYWQRRFGGDPDVLGETLLLNGQPMTVVGVAPEGFTGSHLGIGTELWLPAEREELAPMFGALDERGNRSFLAVARLADGVTLEQARTATAVLVDDLRERFPDHYRGVSFKLLPEGEAGLHPAVRGAFVGLIGVLMAVVSLVLLVACANVAGLLLARAAGRRREIGVHVALGARARHLIRRQLVESLVLVAIAASLGLFGAWATVRFLASVEPPLAEFPLHAEFELDTTVLLFTVAVSALTVLLFGLVPALQAGRLDVVESLKAGVSRLGGASRGRTLLVVAQIALSVMLIVTAGLFVRALQSAQEMDLGFDTDNALLASVDLGLSGYDDEESRSFFRQLRSRIETLPGVRNVSLAWQLPFGLDRSQMARLPEGHEIGADESPPLFPYNIVDVGYFETLDIPLVAGRVFSERDDVDAPRVAVVNRALAERYWPDDTAIGKRLGEGESALEIVGVVETAKYYSLAEGETPYFYLPLRQRDWKIATLHVRTAGDPRALEPLVRREVAALDPSLPVYGVKTFDQQVEVALLPARLGASVLGVFGLLALLLASIGLYGVLAYAVVRRRREIGIRMALGADRGSVVGLVVRQGVRVVVIGLLVGAAGAFVVGNLLQSFLYGVTPLDPTALLSSLLVLLAAAALACLLPAWKATRTDPMTTLRAE